MKRNFDLVLQNIASPNFKKNGTLSYSFKFFAPRPRMGSIARMEPKPLSSWKYMSRPSPPTHIRPYMGWG